jgi:hypothetical protein
MAKTKPVLPLLEAGPVPLAQIRQALKHCHQWQLFQADVCVARDVECCFCCCRSNAKKQLVDIVDSVSYYHHSC